MERGSGWVLGNRIIPIISGGGGTDVHPNQQMNEGFKLPYGGGAVGPHGLGPSRPLVDRGGRGWVKRPGAGASVWENEGGAQPFVGRDGGLGVERTAVP